MFLVSGIGKVIPNKKNKSPQVEREKLVRSSEQLLQIKGKDRVKSGVWQGRKREQYKEYLRGKDLARPKAHGGSFISVSYSENYSSGLSLFFSTGHHLSVREGNFLI